MIPHDLAACCEYDLTSHRTLVDTIRNIASRNKEVFGVNLGHMWDEIDRMTGWIDQLMSLWERAGGGFRREVQPRRQHWFLNEKSGFPFRTPAFCSVSRGQRRFGENIEPLQ